MPSNWDASKAAISMRQGLARLLEGDCSSCRTIAARLRPFILTTGPVSEPGGMGRHRVRSRASNKLFLLSASGPLIRRKCGPAAVCATLTGVAIAGPGHWASIPAIRTAEARPVWGDQFFRDSLADSEWPFSAAFRIALWREAGRIRQKRFKSGGRFDSGRVSSGRGSK